MFAREQDQRQVQLRVKERAQERAQELEAYRIDPGQSKEFYSALDKVRGEVKERMREQAEIREAKRRSTRDQSADLAKVQAFLADRKKDLQFIRTLGTLKVPERKPEEPFNLFTSTFSFLKRLEDRHREERQQEGGYQFCSQCKVADPPLLKSVKKGNEVNFCSYDCFSKFKF